MDSLQKATAVAKILIASGPVSNVYLFGSVGRGYEYATEIDMIACVTDELFRDFAGRLTALDANSNPGKFAYVAFELLGIDNQGLYELLDTGQRLHLLLFPTGWLGKLAEVNEAFHLSDTEFAREIARDALWFSPGTDVFDPLPASSWDYDAGDGFTYTYSLEHGCTTIIVDGPVVDRRAFFAKARELEAYDESKGRYCVDFRHATGNSVGPELLTYEEVFVTLVNIPEPALS